MTVGDFKCVEGAADNIPIPHLRHAGQTRG